MHCRPLLRSVSEPPAGPMDRHSNVFGGGHGGLATGGFGTDGGDQAGAKGRLVEVGSEVDVFVFGEHLAQQEYALVSCTQKWA